MTTPAGRPEMVLRGKRLPGDRARIMAIVNRTPDSFYDKGSTFADDTARAAIRRHVAEGADVIDIGGVKAGPGQDVDVDEELRRVLPVVEWTREQFPQVVISVDTWRHEVGLRVCEAGADLINDTWQGADDELVDVAAQYGAGYVCSHTGGYPPRSPRPHRANYQDITGAVIDEVCGRAEDAVARGVPRESVLIDPTHDFGKNTWHGLRLLRELDRLVATGWPVLMAISNKDFIAETLGTTTLSDRLYGTLAATALAANAGAALFRAHQVAETRLALDMVASIRGEFTPARVIRGLA